MNMKNLISICFLGFLILNSCASYIIPIDSLKSQFAGIDSTKLIEVKVVGPYGERYDYFANPIKTIWCKDSNGSSLQLTNSPSIEVRVTYMYESKSKRAIFYFDRLNIVNNYLVGVQSRFISAIRKSIPLDKIVKIEIQDGRKNFHYVQK
jgi:hypothetical protein